MYCDFLVICSKALLGSYYNMGSDFCHTLLQKALCPDFGGGREKLPGTSLCKDRLQRYVAAGQNSKPSALLYYSPGPFLGGSAARGPLPKVCPPQVPPRFSHREVTVWGCFKLHAGCFPERLLITAALAKPLWKATQLQAWS